MKDYGALAQAAAQERLNVANEMMELEEGLVVVDGRFAGPGLAECERLSAQLVGPYDGCEVCVIREVLDAAWPILQQAATDEQLEKLDVAAGDTLLFRVNYKLGPEVGRELSERLREVLPEGVKALIIDSSTEVSLMQEGAVPSLR